MVPCLRGWSWGVVGAVRKTTSEGNVWGKAVPDRRTQTPAVPEHFNQESQCGFFGDPEAGTCLTGARSPGGAKEEASGAVVAMVSGRRKRIQVRRERVRRVELRLPQAVVDDDARDDAVRTFEQPSRKLVTVRPEHEGEKRSTKPSSQQQGNKA